MHVHLAGGSGSAFHVTSAVTGLKPIRPKIVAHTDGVNVKYSCECDALAAKIDIG